MRDPGRPGGSLRSGAGHASAGPERAVLAHRGRQAGQGSAGEAGRAGAGQCFVRNRRAHPDVGAGCRLVGVVCHLHAERLLRDVRPEGRGIEEIARRRHRRFYVIRRCWRTPGKNPALVQRLQSGLRSADQEVTSARFSRRTACRRRREISADSPLRHRRASRSADAGRSSGRWNRAGRPPGRCESCRRR